MKILVVDDEEAIRKVVSVLLSSLGFTILTARNLTEARHFLDDCDIVLTDKNIGEENGLDFIKEIKKPAFVMSGNFSDFEDETAFILTGHGIIQKPFTFDIFASLFSPFMKSENKES